MLAVFQLAGRLKPRGLPIIESRYQRFCLLTDNPPVAMFRGHVHLQIAGRRDSSSGLAIAIDVMGRKHPQLSVCNVLSTLHTMQPHRACIQCLPHKCFSRHKFLANISIF